MGLMTAIMIGSALLSASSAISQSEDEAQARVDQADIQADNKAKKTRMRAARQKVSFLNSGLTLGGTPLSAIQSTLNTGLEDVDLITSNANKQAKNIISNGRTQAITSLVSAGAGAFGGGAAGAGSGAGGAFASLGQVNNVNQTWDFTDNFSSSAIADRGYSDAGGFGPYRY